MRVFLSWSGARSRMLAEALRDWLPSVLQNVQPWMSAVDMQAGARWNIDLAKELETAKAGIICVTSDNQNAPWMLFEAGALSKVVGASCVIPYLLNMRLGELDGPLVQFQAAVANRDDTFKLVSTLNRLLETLTISDDGLDRTFKKWWPDLEAAIANISRAVESEPPQRSEREMLEELLNLSRQNAREQIERTAQAENVARRRQEDLMVMTHQIQGPLISVATSLSVAARQENAAAALPFVENARTLVEDVLALGYGISAAFAAESGQGLALRPVEINVQEEVRKVAARIRGTTARDDLRFSFKEAAGFPRLLLDEQSLTSVMYSLVHNAAMYADEGSEVIFECALAEPDSMPVLRVTSVGVPIPPDDRERVFQKFWRGRQSELGRMHTGAGLGLWVARSLMRQLGGDVTVEVGAQNPRATKFVVHFGSGSVA